MNEPNEHLAGAYYTPQAIVDAACGSGAFLLAILTITCRCNTIPKLLSSLPEVAPGVRACGWCKSYFNEHGAQIDFDFKSAADALCVVEEMPKTMNI